MNHLNCMDEHLNCIYHRGMQLRAWFIDFDTENSGFITSDQVKKFVKDSDNEDEISESEIAELLKACDDKGDGKFVFEEFVKKLVQ